MNKFSNDFETGTLRNTSVSRVTELQKLHFSNGRYLLLKL